jgi:hypothetical protein
VAEITVTAHSKQGLGRTLLVQDAAADQQAEATNTMAWPDGSGSQTPRHRAIGDPTEGQRRHRSLPVGAASPTPARRVVVAAEPVTDVDTSAADVIQSLKDDLAAAGVELHFAEVKDPVKDRLKRYGLLELIRPEHFYPTVGAAVDAYVAESGVEWREEDSEPNAAPEGR